MSKKDNAIAGLQSAALTMWDVNDEHELIKVYTECRAALTMWDVNVVFRRYKVNTILSAALTMWDVNSIPNSFASWINSCCLNYVGCKLKLYIISILRLISAALTMWDVNPRNQGTYSYHSTVLP